MIRQSKKSTSWTLVTLGIAMSLQLGRMPWTVLALTLAPFAWRVTAELKHWKPIHRIVRYIALGLALASLFMSYGNMFGRRSVVSLLTMMLTLKLLETYSVRDARLVLSFSFFLCATQFLFDQGILMPIYGGLVILSALIALTQLQRDEAFSDRTRKPVINLSTLAELRFSLRLVMLAVPIGLMLFMFFPRWASPLWGIPESTLDAKTGLSDSLAPGSIEQLFMDDSAAFRVKFKGQVPRISEMYWRGPVFWKFDGRAWRAGFMGSNIEANARPLARTAPWNYTVQMEPNERKWLFALKYPATVPHNARLSMDYQMFSRTAVTQLREYSVASDPNFIDSPELMQELRAQALELPDGYNPLSRRLAEKFRAQSSSDFAIVQRVLNHFNEEEFHYTLQAPPLGRDSVDEFLFDTRRGYCEHYASSFTVLMRMAGVPARVVTGYQGGWYNALGSYLLVKQSDAHAWSEVWLPGSGWTRVDPTSAVSPMRIEQGSLGALSQPRHILDFAWFRNMRNGLDIVQQRWNDWVIEFDAGSQSRLLTPFGIKDLNNGTLVVIMIIACGILIAILFPFMLRIRGPQKTDPLRKLWHKFLKRLEKAGFKWHASLGPMELGAAAALQLPDSAESIGRVTDVYARIRYAPTPPLFEELKDAIGQFRPTRSQSQRS